MGFERKFKDGDKVRVIDINSSNYKKVGIIKWYGYPLHIKDAYFKKKIYYVDFKTYSHEFYSHQLEKVEDSNNTNTKSNRLSISNLKPGIKIKIRPDLKEGYSTQTFVTHSMSNLKDTIQTIKNIERNGRVWLIKSNLVWDIDCFSEIVEESKEEIKTSDSSSESINSIEKDSSIAEVGIITKVNFTLTDFKSEKLEHSKFTVL